MNKELLSRIQTSRLILREPRESDAATIFFEYTQDSEVARYMIWRPHDRLAETENFIADCIHAWSTEQRKPFIVALSSREEKPIGMLDAHLHAHTATIGYVLSRHYWGNGYMPEAINTLAKILLNIPALFRIQALCDIENKASARTLGKSGFIHEGTLKRHTVHPNISSEPRTCLMYARCK